MDSEMLVEASLRERDAYAHFVTYPVRLENLHLTVNLSLSVRKGGLLRLRICQ